MRFARRLDLPPKNVNGEARKQGIQGNIHGTRIHLPGQGSQAVGMGKDLADAFPEARAVFQEVDDALGEKLSDIMWNGPETR